MQDNKKSKTLIGVFDSGVGGLSVWRELIKILPDSPFIYVSDSAFCPYGFRTQEEIIKRTKSITEFLISKRVSIIVIACNTATAAAIDTLRKDYDISFIGMEPAIKPAAIHSKTGVIGVLATQGTFKGKLYHKTLDRFASDITVIEQVGAGLVELVEAGKIHGKKTKDLLKKYLDPMIAAKADHIVLGCTHYPFLIDEIKKITGENIVIVDPAPAVAQHVFNTLVQSGQISNKILDPSHQTTFFSTGSTKNLEKMAKSIIPSIPQELFFKNII